MTASSGGISHRLDDLTLSSKLLDMEQIVRLVKMTFDPGKVPEFLEIFRGSCDRIRGQEGCLHLELLADVRHPNVMMTYSVWSSEDALERYRNSELFRETWSKTRPLFVAKPEATSFRSLWNEAN